VASGKTVSESITLNLPDGARTFDFSMRPLFDAAGAVVAIVPEAIETTARLKAEEDLRQAQKLEAVGQLTGGVAHDFNNLLMVISGGLNMLERSDTAERRGMLISRMREAVERGATLTRQLLAFSRRQTLKPESIALPSYFAGMSDLLSRSLGVSVRVDFDVPEDTAPVSADPNALQLAILNLAVNARDAMNDSGVVRIRARNGRTDDPNADCVSISVSDTGEGMTPDVRARIFEPFFTTKETGKGSGLGLAQVHGFAQQSEGHVEVETAEGSGTTVTLVLPRGEAPAEQQRAPPPAPRERAAQDAAGKALLVEDDDNVAALTSEMLSHLGWRVTRVASAEAALGAITNGLDVGLVFSDVMMPGGKNGLELAEALRKRHVDLPIVLASGYTETVHREAERAGLPLLSKPFDLDMLAAAIDAARGPR
jgi:signal transduction histidine kinase